MLFTVLQDAAHFLMTGLNMEHGTVLSTKKIKNAGNRIKISHSSKMGRDMKQFQPHCPSAQAGRWRTSMAPDMNLFLNRKHSLTMVASKFVADISIGR